MHQGYVTAVSYHADDLALRPAFYCNSVYKPFTFCSVSPVSDRDESRYRQSRIVEKGGRTGIHSDPGTIEQSRHTSRRFLCPKPEPPRNQKECSSSSAPY